jgi:hypothetical protein
MMDKVQITDGSNTAPSSKTLRDELQCLLSDEYSQQSGKTESTFLVTYLKKANFHDLLIENITAVKRRAKFHFK